MQEVFRQSDGPASMRSLAQCAGLCASMDARHCCGSCLFYFEILIYSYDLSFLNCFQFQKILVTCY
jgi:hypothetical protein